MPTLGGVNHSYSGGRELTTIKLTSLDNTLRSIGPWRCHWRLESRVVQVTVVEDGADFVTVLIT